MIPWQNRITVFGAGIMNAYCFPLHHSVNALHSAKVTECSHMFSLYVMLLSTISCNILWWRHQMETFSALLAFVRGVHRIPVTKASDADLCLMFSLICAWINCWIKKRVAGDQRRHRAHCDATVMFRADDYIHNGRSVQCRFDAVTYLPNPYNRHPIARPWGRDVGCLLWFWSLIYDLLLLSHCRW